jgi:hypothetical protein
MTNLVNCCNGKEASDLTQSVVAAMEKIKEDAEKLAKFINGTEYEQVALGGVDTDTLRRFKAKIDGILDGAIAQAEARMELLVDAARAEADRVAELIAVSAITSGEYNSRLSWLVEADVATGEILTLPGYYLPGRDVLYLTFNGIVCTPKKPLVEASGAYQYEEIGDIDELSNQVKLKFDAPAGSQFDMWVVALSAQQVTSTQAAASAAQESATAAAASETAAAASETAAALSETAAEASEDAAEGSAAAALTSKNAAATSATNAAASAAAALASENAAGVSAAHAEDFAGNAGDSAADAASSASGAASNAEQADESAQAAGESEVAAAASEAASAASETAAAASAQSAQQSAEIAGTAASGTKDRGTVVNALTSQGTGYGITAVSITDGGEDYEAGDALIMGDSESLVDAILVVDAVDGDGAITDISISKSGVWPSQNLGALTVSGGHGTGFDPGFTVSQVAYTTLANIAVPTLNDSAYVVQDEVHNNSTYLWKYADYNGDGVANWVPITAFGSTIKPASTTQEGIVELATAAETIAGTDATRAVTPSGLKDTLASLTPARKDQTLTTAIAANDTWETPSYIVGTKKLQIYVCGELATPGTSTSNGFYQEVGNAGAASTSIKIFDALHVGASLTAVVAA